MLTTEFLPGSPCWVDVGSPDIEATAGFYSDLFGWRFQPAMEGYGFWQADGKTVAAAGSVMEEGAAASWMVYFQTPDCDATAKAVELAGGLVRAQPFDIEGQGRMAQFTDPAGAEFAAWQPGGTRGLDVVTDPGSFAWAELFVPDTDGIRGFYRSVFGWRFDDVDMGDLTYPVVSPAEGGADSSMAGLVGLPPGDRAHWVPFFEVPDCDGVVARCQELGGTVRTPVDDVPGVGRIAYLSDPHGARFAVITSTA
ncbi:MULTISPECIES: VOC family protein [Nonomuraea]|uniref:VOC family protein n=1 Tax=Nonomuraea ferruginea TaxID=46174 RepID=A0ABT4T9C6_9ACTN|nr:MULTISPECIES: VOC family protein [Nonomuraea]MDA0645725.1 VOC family protein [Nonomuraea ferruginea]TXK39899.1 VOC family protein [Nonomuraea sp. C10]